MKSSKARCLPLVDVKLVLAAGVFGLAVLLLSLTGCSTPREPGAGPLSGYTTDLTTNHNGEAWIGGEADQIAPRSETTEDFMRWYEEAFRAMKDASDAEATRAMRWVQ